MTLLISRRVLRDVEPERHRVALSELLRQADLTWHGVKLHQPDWGQFSHSIAFTSSTPERMSFHAILNAYREPLDFELPSPARGAPHPWRRWINTFLDSPHDIVDWDQAPPVSGQTYRAERIPWWC